MQKEYIPKDIELKVQNIWDKNKQFNVTEQNNKEKYYCLSMLPYPSGNIHMGHVRNYTIGDVIARYQRLLGKNVLQPIGWDAFGLPAENAAVKNSTIPAVWTYKNINYMKKQLKSLGYSYDWSRELTTCQPEYYYWEQLFFIRLYEKNLVYKKTAEVNWCEKDQTVLANEQVIDGCCWRCDTKVKIKEISQWFMKITDYAEDLLNDLDHLPGWPEKVKVMQRNWIGRSEGLEIFFKLAHPSKESIIVYTTRPDTIMGVTYINLSINHPLSLKNAKNNIIVANFIEEYHKTKISEADISKREKIGIITDLLAIHPLTGELIPVCISNFIQTDYATGAVMSVPAHNQQDWEFAIKYHLPIKSVILNIDGSKPDTNKSAMLKKGILFNSGKFNGLNYKNAVKIISEELISKKIAERKVHYRLRDWNISRQRYWGTPIPMVTLEDGTVKPMPKDCLPVILPENIEMDGIKNPLKIDFKWNRINLNNQIAFRETDTFDTFMESSWYYVRYTCPNYKTDMVDSLAANYWLPVDQYIGGIEHAIMHLMYFRFYHKLLRDAGFLKCNEPVKRLLCQGMVLSDSFYYIKKNGDREWVSPLNVNIERDQKGQIIKAIDNKGHLLVYAGMNKMSKSKNNGIDPQSIIDHYGADTLRLFIMFAAPVEMTLQWKESGIIGANRFLKRLWKLVFEHKQISNTDSIILSNLNNNQKVLSNLLNNTIVKVTDDIERRRSFNTAIAAIMQLVNALIHNLRYAISKEDIALRQEILLVVTRLLYPFTPHICYVLWQYLGGHGTIDDSSWPVPNKLVITNDSFLILIQVNGKLRDKITITDKNITEEEITKLVLKRHSVTKHIAGLMISQVIYIPSKLINFVTN
ncbi:leucine--tRNA ligase [Candidatus Pantoea edessiphila]|uniref:Leucine--tRNA ligase n=1 Tax=Candidatus Pantoea edessiphila TaxID=2044610 RepID=A0A2P5SZ49_9GAMM|nr:leucine--tRNA ligase [Candidatus Pantoea edessiphila]MBK4775290.1 leucine--tRNA ligase [Pantoea sp. Edef]PPI87572.1 leucine--tRNA ligase [Candidatus Pantoea edessiphila]